MNSIGPKTAQCSEEGGPLQGHWAWVILPVNHTAASGSPTLFSVSGELCLTKGNDRKMQHLHYCLCNCFTVVQYSQVNKWEEGLLLKGKLWGWADGVCPPGITRYTQLTQIKRGKKVEIVTLIKGKTFTEAKITIRVLEQDKGVSFALQSSSCTKWRLEFEDRHTHSPCKHLQEQPVFKQCLPG